jgi:uncharacterized protein
MNGDPAERIEHPVPHVLSRAWQRRDEVALEHFSLQSMAGHLLLSGQITSVIDHVPSFVNYTVACGQNWGTREAHVHMNSGGVTSLIRLVCHDNGLWQVDGEDRADLRDAEDLDIQWTPSTNALPINRLSLRIGESRQVDAAWVRLPEMRVERLAQRYTRLDTNIYRYESGSGRFEAELIIDEQGFVERYGDVWQCIGKA